MDRFGGLPWRGTMGYLLLAGLLLGQALPAAAPASVQEQALKAAFICHFLALTRWPEPKPALVIGVYGDSSLGDELAAALPKTVGALSITVLRLQPKGQDWTGIQALYIPRVYQAEVPGILQRLGNAPVLTIGDSFKFMENGGLIGFVQEGSRLRFEVNQGMAGKKGLLLSAKMLELAKTVQR